jgi:hypothetical protein
MTFAQLFWWGIWPLIVAGIVLAADHWNSRLQ